MSESHIPTMKYKRIKVCKVAKMIGLRANASEKAKREFQRRLDAGCEVGKPYWYWTPRYRGAKSYSPTDPGPQYSAQPLTRNGLVNACKDAIESLALEIAEEDWDEEGQAERDRIAGILSEAADHLRSCGEEYGESRDNMPVEGSEMWERLDEVSNNLEDAASDCESYSSDAESCETFEELASIVSQATGIDIRGWDDV